MRIKYDNRLESMVKVIANMVYGYNGSDQNKPSYNKDGLHYAQETMKEFIEEVAHTPAESEHEHRWKKLSNGDIYCTLCGAVPQPQAESEPKCVYCDPKLNKVIRVDDDGTCIVCGNIPKQKEDDPFWKKRKPQPEGEIEPLTEHSQHIWVDITDKNGKVVSPIELSFFLSKITQALNRLAKKGEV